MGPKRDKQAAWQNAYLSTLDRRLSEAKGI